MQTARLRLECWSHIHFGCFADIARDPDVMRFINGGVPWADFEIREFIRRQMRHRARKGFCMWRIVRRPDGRTLGFCGLQPLNFENRNAVEIGWWLAKQYWRRGLATESARLAMKQGFARARLTRVIAIAMPQNAASRHVMHKLGMRYVRSAKRRGFDVVVYSVAR
ncbi:MAG TPA: GNAT family N-acetyltransferase [Candidatus Acidoferrales bacterium]|nr:GNAT family N-acetyltransferase [Candidatus Acidoferrales bacterium]